MRKLKIITVYKISVLFILFLFSLVNYAANIETFDLTVNVEGLRNSEGNVQFSLYNKEGTIPDEEYQRYFKMQSAEIKNGTSSIVFRNLPKGRYAVNVLHDENRDGKIDKGFIFPVEGIGFSNYSSIGLGNRPNFLDASFELTANVEKVIKIIYF